jgi:hypothetical protein
LKNEANRREFTRVPVQVEVEVTSEKPPTVSGQATDVSLKGRYLVCDNPLPLGSDCRVALLLGGRENSLRIEVCGKIARVDDAGMGLEITEIMGLDSFEHLRNLVLYNSTTDTGQVEGEFDSHVGLKRRDPREE